MPLFANWHGRFDASDRRIHLEYHHHLNRNQDQLSSMLQLMEANDFGYQLRAPGPPWPSERPIQEMLIYCYRKHIESDDHPDGDAPAATA
jgi:hypothetical protein